MRKQTVHYNCPVHGDNQNPVCCEAAKRIEESRDVSETTASERRKRVLEEVASCVCKDRMNTYGDAENNFADIAAILTIVLGKKLKTALVAQDVALMLSCVKVGRLMTSPEHRDNWVDLAGYAVCGCGIVDSYNSKPSK